MWTIGGTLLLAPFLVGPLFIYYKWGTSAMPDIVRVHPDQPQMPPAFERFTHDTLRALYPDGFELAAAALLFDGAPNQRFLALLENPRRRDVAVLTLCARGRVWRRRLHWSVRSTALEFISEYPGDPPIATDNHGYIRSCSAPARHLSLPGWRNARTLYAVHCARVHQLAPYATKCRLTEGRPLEYLRALHVKDVYAQICAKDLALDDQTALAQPTFKGAWKTGWKELTPLFWLWAAWQYGQALRLPRYVEEKPLRRPVPA